MRELIFWLVVVATLGLLLYLFPTNPKEDPSQKEVVSVTDVLTGCQYLRVSPSAGITPRMGRDGKQICKEISK